MPRKRKDEEEMPPFVPLGRDEEEVPGIRVLVEEDGSYRAGPRRGKKSSSGPKPGEDRPRRSSDGGGGSGPVLTLLGLFLFVNVVSYMAVSVLYAPLLGQDPWVLMLLALVLTVVLARTVIDAAKHALAALVAGVQRFQKEREEVTRQRRMNQFFRQGGFDNGFDR
ncbi:MAG: hypothetical protein QF415_09145 [Candidatus Undinarchaeales archaeon]|jgi:hypothetical protein|nr:hypothetical protein [Candidatus Undinarchaeales archaeon]MDP7493173.1 hypothetical protein [Candidatus Undinarchaeales archaeon]